ncbi:Fic family protein [Leptospira sp. GIMC2001]|uniref:Fic family protein n=1 Tax=Leptospira sp. GIMC2001 TaxID=1513297 RepID=UPI00234A5E58|nr:Fic family protein [Leptospira sp. GIMC2001]WCL51186.1 Fic family protein [Leptospira sp. GIMC2001]
MSSTKRDRAIMILQKEISVFVYDAVQLEGINFTLPEVQTLLEGVTIGGHKISDQNIAINQGLAWKQLISWIKDDEFELTITKACDLHAVAAKEDAPEWGKFRSGPVSIAGTNYKPPESKNLEFRFNQMIEESSEIADPINRAISVFLQMARNQFFYDVNKRMGRFFMNGILVNEGLPPINLPVIKKLEFNKLMLDYYPTGKEQAMNDFLRGCINPYHWEILKD